jgi:flagellar biosynthetic protein FliR
MDIEPINIPVKQVLIYLVVLARIAGLVTFAPFWNVATVPKQIRVVLAMCLAMVVSLLLGKKIPTPPLDYLSLAIVITGEVVIGCLIGFIGQLVLSALDIAAQILATQIGFSLASIINPTNRTQTSAIGIMAQMLAIVLFLGIDGHHWLLTATINSFNSFVPGEFSLSESLFYLLIRLSADALAMGMALAAPAMIVLFAVELAIALSGRVAPQLQVMLISFPIKITLGLLMVGTSLYVIPQHIRQVLKVMAIVLKDVFGKTII